MNIAGASLNEIADEIGTSHTTVLRILAGKVPRYKEQLETAMSEIPPEYTWAHRQGSYRLFDDVFDTMTYPYGEPHVTLSPEVDISGIGVVEVEAYDFNTLGVVVSADNIVRRMGHRVIWNMPYFPFARHDRRRHARDGMPLELAMSMVEGLDIVITDPHSDVTASIRHIPQASFVRHIEGMGAFVVDEVDCTIAIPDAGAEKKAYSWIRPGSDVIKCSKRRDVNSGVLSGFEIEAGASVEGKHVIIVDDICDGGGTFLGLGKVLRDAGAKTLTLAVTHGLFTKGVKQLRETFDRIYSTCPTGYGSAKDGVYSIDHEIIFRRAVRHGEII